MIVSFARGNPCPSRRTSCLFGTSRVRSTILIFLPPLIDICTLFDELACVLLPAREEDDAGLVAVDGGLTAVGVGFVTAGFVADGGLAYGLPIRGILVVDLTFNAEPATGCLNLDFTAVVDEPAAPSGVPTSAPNSKWCPF